MPERVPYSMRPFSVLLVHPADIADVRLFDRLDATPSEVADVSKYAVRWAQLVTMRLRAIQPTAYWQSYPVYRSSNPLGFEINVIRRSGDVSMTTVVPEIGWNADMVVDQVRKETKRL